MNLMLHGIGGDKELPIIVADSLASHPGEYFELVLPNPPFGKKSRTTIVNGKGKSQKKPKLLNEMISGQQLPTSS
jgi:type I restriction enzyme M protein